MRRPYAPSLVLLPLPPMHRLALAALAVLPTLAAPLRAAAAQAPLVVTGSWLSQHATDARQVIVHAAASRAEYDAGHVPGARLLLFSSYAPTLSLIHISEPTRPY